MKKMLSLAVAIAAALSMNAKPVTPEKALMKATQFCQNKIMKGAMRAPKLTVSMQLTYTHPDGAFYVVNRGENDGYVIVAGDDCSPQILGYVDSGSFNYDALPDAAREWLAEYARQVGCSAQSGVAYKEQTQTDHAKIAPLLTTTWNQTAPYNGMVPYIGLDSIQGNHCRTGCAANAMSQVLRYHKWPEKAMGTAWGNYCNTRNEEDLNNPLKLPDTDLSGDVFDWDNMLDNYPTEESGTAEQRAAVALLERDCGYSLHTLYTPFGSGALTVDIPSALIYNFGYDKAVHIEYHEWYTDEQWDEMVYNELSTSGPVLYGGMTAQGEGHLFVCDGYDGDGFYHINWGWGGESNGFFRLNALNTTVHLNGTAHDYAYNYRQNITAGLKKPQEGSENVVMIVQTLPFERNDEGNVRCGLRNYSTVKYVGELGFKVTNEATSESTYSSCGNYEMNISASVNLLNENFTLADGTYRMRTAYKPEGGEWTDCRYYNEEFIEYPEDVKEYIITVKDGKKTYTKVTDSIREVSSNSTSRTSKVYNMQGACVATFAGNASMASLPSGMYIVRTLNANGTTSTSKHLVR